MRLLLLLISMMAQVSCRGPDVDAMGSDRERIAVEPAPFDPSALAEEKAALASCGPVTAEGYCGVIFGMSAEAAAARFPVRLEGYDGPDTDLLRDPEQCYELFPAEPVQGVIFTVEKHSVARVDFLSETPRTKDGFGVGSSAADIRTKFGTATREAINKYEAEVSDLTVVLGPAKYVFEVEGGRVRSWRAGLSPVVDYTEHCS